jgi:branched-chain amino acid transport system substrate-binding protein
MKILLALLTILAAVTSQAKETVTVGLASNFSELSTVSFNPFGGYFQNAIELAVSDNKALLDKAGINLELVKYDYGTNDINVIKKAKEASSSNAIAVIGYNYSAPALLSAPIHTEAKIPVIYPSASANRLGTFGKYVHLGSISNQFMVESLAKIATQTLKAKRILILAAVDCAYCMDLANSFTDEMKKYGENDIQNIQLLEKESDFVKVAEEAKKMTFDAVFVPNQELTAARLIAALTEAGITKPFLGADGWGNEGSEFFRVLKGKKFTGYSVTHWHPKLKAKKSEHFVAEYKKRFDKLPNDTSVLAYDSMTLLIQALIKTKPRNRENLEKTLSSINLFDGVTGKSYWQPHQAPKKNMLVLKTTDTGFAINQIVSPKGGSQ